MILQPDRTYKANGLMVKEYLLTKHNPNNIDMPTINLPTIPLGITIHNTESITVSSSTTMAEQYTRATINGNMKDVRVHFYVDDVCAWQNLPLTLSGWHAADGSGNGNRKTIAIEVIGNSIKAETNATKLAAYLLSKYNLTIENNLFTHTHWLNVKDGKTGTIDYLNTNYNTYKNCPIYILPHWTEFKNNVKNILNNNNNNNNDLTILNLYRVRQSWEDTKSQIGAFSSLENAKKACKEGYSVFDEQGNKVYSLKQSFNMTKNEYEYNSNEQISEHFNISEFRCKCGKAHNTKLEPKLVKKLEELYSKLNCSKIIVTSGYRCQNHDKAVGGSGYGQHVLGTASDIICYDTIGNIISTKIVSCVAQDLGFMGIGNIDSSYQAIHVDVRTSNKWYGDEVINNNTVTSNFYDYYGISKSDIQKYTGIVNISDDTFNNTSNDISPIDVYYRVYTNTWLPEVTNLNNYAGMDDVSIKGIVAKTSQGTLKYRVHVNGGGWLGWISEYNINDWKKGCAGIKTKNIDAIQFNLDDADGYTVRYRVSIKNDLNYLDWIVGYNTVDSNGYAGIFGKSIDKIQIEIIKK